MYMVYTSEEEEGQMMWYEARWAPYDDETHEIGEWLYVALIYSPVRLRSGPLLKQLRRLRDEGVWYFGECWIDSIEDRIKDACVIITDWESLDLYPALTHDVAMECRRAVRQIEQEQDDKETGRGERRGSDE